MWRERESSWRSRTKDHRRVGNRPFITDKNVSPWLCGSIVILLRLIFWAKPPTKHHNEVGFVNGRTVCLFMSSNLRNTGNHCRWGSGESAGIIPDEPHIVTHADRHEGFLRWVSLYMLTVTVNSARNKQESDNRKNAQSIRTATNTRMEK